MIAFLFHWLRHGGSGLTNALMGSASTLFVLAVIGWLDTKGVTGWPYGLLWFFVGCNVMNVSHELGRWWTAKQTTKEQSP